MAVCYIVGAAASCVPFVPEKEDLILAADGGWCHVQALGLTPHLTVGDFDSSPRPQQGEVAVYPVEKDDTDTMLAIKLAWERGWRQFCLLAGTGGRPDHTLANLQALLWVAQRGGRAVLWDETGCFTTLVNNTLQFSATAHGTLSVFSQGGTAQGVTLANVYYPLENGTLTADVALGVSNRFVGKPARVQVTDGALLVFWSGTPADLEAWI